jgi:hypothetical protein
MKQPSSVQPAIGIIGYVPDLPSSQTVGAVLAKGEVI